MGDKGSGGKGIKIDPAKDYEKMIKLQLKYLPKQLQAEYANRMEWDPKLIEQALGLQHAYDPQLAAEQRAALIRRDPQFVALHDTLGDKIKEALDRGYLDPRQEAAYDQWAGLAGKVDPRYEAAYNKLFGLAGEIDPRYEAMYARMAASAGKGEPTRDKAYEALGKQVTGDTLRGETLSPEALRQRTQAILARSPNLSYGEAQDMAAASGVGIAGERIKAQRQAATGSFLGQATPTSQREQSLYQALNVRDPLSMRQQSLGSFEQLMDPTRMSQQSLGQFYGAPPPSLQAMGLAGTYIQPSNSIVAAENMIGGVQAPRAFGYVNPQAGMQGIQLGLQNQQANLANQALQGQGGGSSNPWMNALQGAGTGMSMGSVGGPYGAAGGAIVGAAAGAFGYPQYSDITSKINISRTGMETPDGIPIVEYDYNGKRWRGVIAQDVEKVRPDAVHHYGNGTLGVFYSKLGIELKEV